MGIMKELEALTTEELETLRSIVLEKAVIKEGTKKDNIKLGDMGSWAILFGNCIWQIPELNICVRGTCGGNCKGCFNSENPRESDCYVVKSYLKYTNRNEDGTVGDILKNECSVKLGHAYRTIAMTMFRDELLEALDKKLTNKKKKLKIVRINESGELTCYEDLELWCELARRHPETVFYVYTKNYKVIQRAIDKDIIPDNIFINISVWHESGIREYNNMKDHPQIRAFCLVDEEYTKEVYASKGLDITSMCGAYDEKGKMNHAVTCDKCKKCFSKSNKCVGCYEH